MSIRKQKKKVYKGSEFGLINSMIQTIWKNRTKIISAFEWNGSRIKRFQMPEKVASIRHQLSGVSKRQVTHIPVGGPLLMIILFSLNFNFKLNVLLTYYLFQSA